ncbi:acetyl-CoA synthetase-like protein [Rickenella mellea]|uniref:Acetyl-CoA synthetase-like protein n=1 Tax=Rickenella mellea TaxID=50990 RepID=A0A4Y7QJ44_9AGAM|nr:acetyl-CoA synthetase-like protein [Rickenella mellea]
MKIYTSRVPPQPIANESIFSRMFPERDPFPSSGPAFIDADTGKSITRGELKSLALELAWGLQHKLPKLGAVHLKRGDTVMIFSPNSIAWPIALHGSIAAGLRVTLANSAYTPAELAFQLTDSQAKLVFVHPSLVPTLIQTFKVLKIDASEAAKKVVVLGWGLQEKGPGGLVQVEELLGHGALRKEEKFEGKQANETVLLCYSSGTTGKPKGVETTHKNLTSVASIVKPVFPSIVPGKDVFIGVLPFYHIYGVVKLLIFPFVNGAPVVLLQRFEPVAFCKTIETYKVTVGLIVPPILVVLARHPAASQFNLRSLRLLFSGAAPLGAPLVKAVSDRLKSFGNETVITQGYGLTETSPTSHLLPPDDAIRKVGSIGILLPNLEARLVVDDVRDAKKGEPGEIWLRGPTIMKGYLNNSTATKNSITPDGFFKTGDVAIIDDEGFFMIVDRQKELIKYKGFQVPPAELESLLLQHDDIADAGVIGVESIAEATELPRAYVVHAKGLTTDAEKKEFGLSVQKWIQERVAKHKFLRGGVAVIDVIPKSASGKILRRELRDRAKQELQQEAVRAKANL